MTVLETERLALSELDARDAPFILELLTSRGFKENIGDRGVRDLEGAEGYIARTQAGYAANGFGLWRCDLRSAGQPVGICGLVRREGLDFPDVGYAFLEAYWGHGLATESAAAVLAHGQGELGLGRIAAITTPGNKSSIAVLEKIGFRYEGAIQLPSHTGESAYFLTPATSE